MGSKGVKQSIRPGRMGREQLYGEAMHLCSLTLFRVLLIPRCDKKLAELSVSEGFPGLIRTGKTVAWYFKSVLKASGAWLRNVPSFLCYANGCDILFSFSADLTMEHDGS